MLKVVTNASDGSEMCSHCFCISQSNVSFLMHAKECGQETVGLVGLGQYMDVLSVREMSDSISFETNHF